MKKTLGRFSCATFLVAVRYITELMQQPQRRRQTLCDKRDNNFFWKTFKQTSLSFADLFVKDQKTLMLIEDHDKTRN